MQSPRAPRSGTLAWGVTGVCAIGPSPAIPSGLGHKYQCPGGWRRCRIPPLWHDHKSPSFPKQVCHKPPEAQNGRHVLVPVTGGAARCPRPWSGPQEGAEITPRNPSFLAFSERQGTADTKSPAVPSHAVWDRLHLAGAWLGTYTCPCPLSRRHGSWV